MAISEQKAYIIHAIEQIGELTPSQLSRFLFASGLCEPFDLMAVLAELVSGGELEQKLSANGIVYSVTEKGQAIPAGALPEAFAVKAAEYAALFDKEKDYIAQYTEQANAVFPVFLSVRSGDTILLHVNLIVDDAATAKEITANWMQNARKTYDAIWANAAPGLPQPNAPRKRWE